MDEDYDIGPAGPHSGPILRALLSSIVVREPMTVGEMAVALVFGSRHPSRVVELWTDGWGVPGDGGVLAWDEAGVAVGGGWFRPVESWGEDPEEPPELVVVVRQPHRGRGLGRQLLAAAVEEARRFGIPVLRGRVGDRTPHRRRALEPYASSSYREGGAEVFVIPTDPKKLSEAP